MTRPRQGAAKAGLIAVAVVVVIAGGMIALRASKKEPPAPPDVPAAPPVDANAVVSLVTSVPQATLDAVGAGKNVVPPTALPADTPPLTLDGKPEVLSVGAEFCPYCAAERWALTNALSRFGTFTGVGLMTSAADDVFPSTPTLTFRGSTYTSDFLAFVSLETSTNRRGPTGDYEPLEQPTAEQVALVRKYDAPPYVPPPGGSIPFVMLGNKFIISGSNYRPDVLQGKTSSAVANALADAANPITQEAMGAANVITAALCQLTKEKPASACSTPAVTAAATVLPKK